MSPLQDAEGSTAPKKATPAAQPKLDEAPKPQQQQQAAPAADRSTAGAPVSAAAASAPAKPAVATFAAMASQAPKAAAGAAAEVATPAAKPAVEPVATPAAAAPKQQGKDDVDGKLQAAAAADVAKAAASSQSAAPADSTVEKLPLAKTSVDKQPQQPAAAEPQQQQQATAVPAAAAAVVGPSQAQPTNLAANAADALTGKAPEVAKPEASAKEADSKKGERGAAPPLPCSWVHMLLGVSTCSSVRPSFGSHESSWALFSHLQLVCRKLWQFGTTRICQVSQGRNWMTATDTFPAACCCRCGGWHGVCQADPQADAAQCRR